MQKASQWSSVREADRGGGSGQVWLPKAGETQTRRQCAQSMPRAVQLLAGAGVVTAVLDVGSARPPACGAPRFVGTA